MESPSERAFYNFFAWLGRTIVAAWRGVTTGARMFWASAFRYWLRDMLFPLQAERRRNITNFSRILTDELYAVEDDWLEHLLDHRQAPEYAEARHRASIRRINSILNHLRRSYPKFDINDGRHVMEVQDAVHGHLNRTPKVQPLKERKTS